MVGHRRTHNYPHGKPFPLVLVDILIAVVVGLWVFLVPGHWPRAIGIIVVFLIIAFIRGKLTKRYERTGQAVPIPRPRLIVRFPRGLPFPMLAMRLAFFITVALMVMFGVAPVADSTAKTGIISCIFVLIGLAILNIAFERHYVNTGRAQETDVRSGRAS